MTKTDRIFAGSIPAIYDRYLRPLIFEPFAIDLAHRLVDLGNGSLLEIAAGTGVLTRALHRILPDSVAITATDLNQPMLDFAAVQLDAPSIVWRQADALNLPFADGVFDVVVCQFGVMFFPDKPAAYRESLRVLKPGGKFVFNAWDSIEENEVTHAVSEGVAAIFPKDPPQFLARTPHGYHNTDQIKRDLQSAGFSQIMAETAQKRSRAPACHDPAIGFCQGTPLRNEIEGRAPELLVEATESAAAAVRERFGDGPVDGKMQAHIVIAKL